MQTMTKEEIRKAGMDALLSYDYDENGFLVGAPCACDECRAGQRGELRAAEWGQGHFLCEFVPANLLQAEQDGLIEAVFQDNWKWRYSWA